MPPKKTPAAEVGQSVLYHPADGEARAAIVVRVLPDDVPTSLARGDGPQIVVKWFCDVAGDGYAEAAYGDGLAGTWKAVA